MMSKLLDGSDDEATLLMVEEDLGGLVNNFNCTQTSTNRKRLSFKQAISKVSNACMRFYLYHANKVKGTVDSPSLFLRQNNYLGVGPTFFCRTRTILLIITKKFEPEVYPVVSIFQRYYLQKLNSLMQ